MQYLLFATYFILSDLSVLILVTSASVGILRGGKHYLQVVGYKIF